ncbi:RpiB/LacA/LacB family sugar-phosphate isomerase [Lacrimispora sp.]|uniref:RpiB/LacA/LacB family sugar-phosphate isomerase n=1 Tax=Lacrimispora sp. TaxID=2719234 RepID=UPI0028AF05AF|nr:RpiB/LacA/LacB family sugar-phosphate isomerase [Lacrimispora sp.]
MTIGVIQASSQSDKNKILEKSVKMAVANQDHQVINFGVFGNENLSFSYVQIALCISMLIESKAVDFVVTGCSSGQGMMLACNSLPGILCGYIENPTDAYLFGRINHGNVASYPLGLNYGWAGEINLQNTMNALFEEPFGIGYPAEDAQRKKEDTLLLKRINAISKKSLIEILPDLDQTFVKSSLAYEPVRSYIMQNGKDEKLKQYIKTM